MTNVKGSLKAGNNRATLYDNRRVRVSVENGPALVIAEAEDTDNIFVSALSKVRNRSMKLFANLRGDAGWLVIDTSRVEVPVIVKDADGIKQISGPPVGQLEMTDIFSVTKGMIKERM